MIKELNVKTKMPPKKKAPFNINKRYLTVSYQNVDKKAAGIALSSKTLCDGYIIATCDKGCIAKLYRQNKYHFVSKCPSFLKINNNGGLIIDDIDDDKLFSLDKDYLVDGSHFLKKMTVQPTECNRQVCQNQEVKIDWTTKSDILLRAMIMKRKQEFGLDDESIKTLDRESIILLLS
jgi:hypothetical protein